MLLSRRLAPALGFLLIALPSGAQAPLGADREATPVSAPRGAGEAGHGSLLLQLGLYHQVDQGDGNPFLDEKLTVIEPVVILDYNATDRLATTATLAYDHLSSASVDRIPGQSKQWGGADDYYAGGDLALRYRLHDELQVGGHLGYSAESDYHSFAFGANTAWSRADQNATVSLSVDGFADQVDVNRFDGSDGGSEHRSTVSGTLVWYQVMSPVMHGELGFTGTYQTGFLETPFNFVVIEDPALPPNPELANRARGRQVVEALPESRRRGALFGRVRRSLRPGTAVELGGRLYADSWGIESLAIEPRWYQTLFSPAWLMRLRYRYYAQSAADSFRNHFRQERGHRTQDSDLGALDSHTVGGKLTWQWRPAHRLSVAGDYVARSDGLDQTFYTLTWVWDF